MDQGHYDDAKKMLVKAHDLYSEICSAVDTAVIEGDLADIYYHRGEFDRAEVKFFYLVF